MADANRGELLTAFLKHAGWDNATQTPLSGDASFRRYIRLDQNGRRAMVMDAPPTHEDVRPFVQIDKHLRLLGFSAPEILAENELNGFLLLEDFGDTTFTNLLAAGEDEEALYRLGTDLLITLHALDAGTAAPDWLAPYDDATLHNEVALLLDWFMPARGLDITTEARAEFEKIWLTLFTHVHRGPRTLVLRDYHIDNLMRLNGRERIQACGLLDFQDALAGHPAYDLMSLLEDARRDIAPELQGHMKACYRDALNLQGAAWDDFETAYAILGAQRHAKVIGIFTRLDRRDGKPIYLKHIARVWRLFEASLMHPALANMKTWIDQHIPPDQRKAPEPSAS